jgi:hypothetical protein
MKDRSCFNHQYHIKFLSSPTQARCVAARVFQVGEQPFNSLPLCGLFAF